MQNFRAKPDTKRATAPEPDLDDLLWSIAAARLILPDDVHVQAPPNLSPGVYQKLIDAGIDDWGGVSPVTPDHVNPEAPWPQIEALAERTAAMGKVLVQRLPVYPAYAFAADRWCAPDIATRVRRAIDAEGWAREDDWAPGLTVLPKQRAAMLDRIDPAVGNAVAKAVSGARLDEAEIVRLFAARDADYDHVITAADALRQSVSGETVRYVVNRNINYTNICYYRCRFCAFSKGKTHEALRGTPYDLALDEVVRRSQEAWDRGATEVCLQGGIHPDYTGATYLGICRAIKAALPDMHIHAFSPLEVTQGAATLGLSLREFLAQLKDAGLGTLPGTAAEILDDEVRAIICPDKVNTAQWLEVLRAAHRARTAHHLDDHVRPCRTPGVLGAASAGAARSAGGDRRHHRVRAAAVRAHGSADVSARPGTQGADLARGGADARGGAAGAASADHQHPDVVGEDGAGWRRAVPERRRQRSRRHADEREHLAGGRHAARAGVSARGDGGADPLDRARSAPARYAVPPRRAGAARCVVRRAGAGAGGADAATQGAGGGVAHRIDRGRID